MIWFYLTYLSIYKVVKFVLMSNIWRYVPRISKMGFKTAREPYYYVGKVSRISIIFCFFP